MSSPSEDPILATLARLVVKDGLGLGGLSFDQRCLALGAIWATLPTGGVSEAQMNQLLRGALAGPACWLTTDHVELRRWLVDTGWLKRDGFGRCYERVALPVVATTLQPVATALATLDVAEFVGQARQRHQQERAERHQAWRKQA